VWQVDTSSGEYEDGSESGESKVMDGESAGGTMVVDEVAEDADVDELVRLEGTAEDAASSSFAV
jgi:hypothetical protein